MPQESIWTVLITIVGVSVLFSLQTYLISQNVTGIEYHIHRPIESSPYYKPHNILRNFQKVLGNNVALWFIPVFYESKEEEDEEIEVEEVNR